MESRHAELEAKIDLVLTRWQRAILIKGISITLLCAMGIFLLALGLDYALGFNKTLRLVMLTSGVGGSAYALLRWLVRPLSRRPTPLQVARYIEEHHPHLEDGLVSAIEFAPTLQPGEQGTSTTWHVLVGQLIRDTLQRLQGVDPGRPMRRRVPVVWGGLAALGMLLIVALVLQSGVPFGRLSLRFFIPWATPGPLYPLEIMISPGDARLPYGAKQTIMARVSGKVPTAVAVVSQTAAGDWVTTEMAETIEEGVFTFTFERLTETTRYYAKAAEAVSPTYTLAVYQEPRVDRIDLTYHYPLYMKRTTKNQPDAGDITAPLGTRVEMKVTANKPIRSGQLRFNNGKRRSLAVDGKTLTTRLSVQSDRSYQIVLEDVDGLTNPNPIEYFIRALPDERPIITFTEPGEDKRVSPLEEVLIQLEAYDDFGLARFDLIYSVNNGSEERVELLEAKSQSRPQEHRSEQMLYLEELAVQPGDFLVYYAEADDGRGKAGTTRSDLFFFEIRPFEELYRQVQSDGGGGGGMMQAGSLGREQKQIILATWRLDREKSSVSQEQWVTDVKTVAEAQIFLKQKAESLQEGFQGQAGDSTLAAVSVHLDKAIEVMERAVERLEDKKTDRALPPERESLAHLLKVDAAMNEYQVTRSSGGSRAREDLSDFSELELKDQQSRYETLQQTNPESQINQQLQESMRKVEELARRQSALNKRSYRMASNPEMTEAERRRGLDRLLRQQTQLRQEAEQLSRQLSRLSRSRQSSMERQATESLRRSSEEMAQAARNLQRDNPDMAAAKGSRALQRLQDARQQLAQGQSQSTERMLEDIARKAENLLDQQRQIVDQLERMVERKQQSGSLDARDAELLNQVKERKQQLANDLQRVTKALRETARQLGEKQPEARNPLNQAAQVIERERLAERIRNSRSQLQEERLLQVFKQDQQIEKILETLTREVSLARDQLGTEQDRLARDLDRTQNMRSRLERLNRQMDRARHNPQQQKRLRRDYQQRMQDIQDMLERMEADTPARDQLANAVRQAIRAPGDEAWKNDFSRWSQLAEDIAQGLAELHQSLAGQLDSLMDKDKLHLTRQESVPEAYRPLVEQYYESLSKVEQKRRAGRKGSR